MLSVMGQLIFIHLGLMVRVLVFSRFVYLSYLISSFTSLHVVPVDTAGMLIMTLAYAMASGNGTLIANHVCLSSRLHPDIVIKHIHTT